MANKKTCFIICAIDEADSEEREWSDFVRNNIIAPVVTECGYEKPARSDDPDIGLLMGNIIEQMFEADLVVADLTYYKPNVFFELGIRHCAQKPVIHLIKAGDDVPFDIEENKAIFLDRDYEKVISAQTEIKQRIEAIRQKPTQFHSLVQQYIQLKQLKLFEKTQTGMNKNLIEALVTLVHSIGLQTGMLRDLKKELVDIPKQEFIRKRAISSFFAKAIVAKSKSKRQILESMTGEKPLPEADDQKQ